MNLLIVPSIRETSMKNFIDSWKSFEEELIDNLIVVEDNATKIFNLGMKHHYSWQEIEGDLGEDSWIISKQDSAIRCYGFLVAYRLGAEYIMTLDDDCYPIQGEKFQVTHVKNIEQSPRWTELILGMRTRGFPYENLGTLDNVVANVGLWTGVPDLDAVHSLTYATSNFEPPPWNRILPIRQYFPYCGMNFAFKREVAVLSYFPLMGQNSPFSRFDDIWFGIIFKKICDHLGLLVSCGHPFVYHSKASNKFMNLVKEAPGIKFNEEFWKIIDDIKLKGNTAKNCMKEIGESLRGNDNEYLKKLGLAIIIWTQYF